MNDTPAPEISESSSVKPTANWLAYVAPMALFLALTALEGYLPRAYYPYLYGFKAFAVTIALIVFRKVWKSEIRFEARVLPIAILTGLAVLVEWVLIDKYVPYPHFGARTALNPYEAFPDALTRWGFLLVRFYGLALLVPVMEEIFWRSFLLRYITGFMSDTPFSRYPIGTYSQMSFWAVALLFGAAHSEWFVGIICAIAYALLLRYTRSLFACIVAHGVTNFALGVYVLMTGDWKYW